MENKSIHHPASPNGQSLHLRSKQGSEVMGNIPAWIGSWGAILMCLFFLGSIIYVINIKAVEQINGIAAISSQNKDTTYHADKNYFISVFVSKAAAKMIQQKQQVSFVTDEKDNPFYGNNSISLPVAEITAGHDSCMLIFALNGDLIKRLKPANKTAPATYACLLETNIKVYKKIFGFLF